MPGFDNQTDSPDDLTVVFADNACWDGSSRDELMSTDGQLWIGSTVAPHVRLGTITGGSGVTVNNSSGSIEISLTGGGMGIDSFTTDVAGPVVPNGAGEVAVTGGQVFSSGSIANTLRLNVEATANTFLYGQGNNVAMSELGPLTNGQLIIGSTGAAPVAGTLTGGPGITITNGAGSITVNSVVFTDTTATTLAVDNGYFATAAGTYNMPATAAQGELIEIVALAAGVILDAPAGDFISINGVTSSNGGTATSTASGDALKLRFRDSNQTWYSISNQGIWTVA